MYVCMPIVLGSINKYEPFCNHVIIETSSEL